MIGGMLRVADVLCAMEGIAPTRCAESWDNVGLIVGDAQREIGTDAVILLTIDLTPAVVDEAIEAGAKCIIAYHPPIFSAVKRFVASTPRAAALLRCAEAGVAVYSPHTALDAAPGGVADWLLEMACGKNAGDQVALSAHLARDLLSTHKIVTMVPCAKKGALERVRSALARAGAGEIGAYTECSFASKGTGSFVGGEGAHPTVGKAGQLEFVEEVRLEMVCPGDRLAEVIAVLREVHPYEETAFDVFERADVPERMVGAGRVGTLAQPQDAKKIADRLRLALNVPVVKLAQASDAPVARAAVCPGSGGSLMDDVVRAGAQVFVTGEMTHHDVLSALDRGVSVILAGHTETERGYMTVLADRLTSADARLRVAVSAQDETPLRSI